MATQVPTAEEFIKKLEQFAYLDDAGNKVYNDYYVKKNMIEFTKLHRKAILEAVKENIKLTDFASEFLQEGASDAIDKNSIDQAYAEELIK